jgi:hypothetical protein
MRGAMIARRLLAPGALFGVLFFAAPAGALQLITESEAALPSDRAHDRGILRGPTIVIVSPAPAAGTIRSPLSLRIRFEAHDGATIDVDTVLLTYMKKPAVDLTQRIRRFIAPTGINVEDAQVPPGTHTLRVNVSDSHGHISRTDFTFTVSK